MRKRSSLLTENNVLLFLEEILCEIFSWLEVKSLLRCKSVCKVWYAVIKNKQFVDMHMMRNEHRFYNIKHRGESLNSTAVEEKMRYLCTSCKGFLLEERLSLASAIPSTKYRLSNPSTKHILDLPHPHKGVVSMQVFLNSCTSSYNVVSVYMDRENKKVSFELIDLGGQSNDPCPNEDLFWRNLNFLEFEKLSTQERYHFTYLMSSEGFLYILVLLKVGSCNPKIICFDLLKQASETLNLPQSLHFSFREVRFRFWRGKPSVAFVVEEKLNVWVLEDYKKQKWADTIVIPLPFPKPWKKVIPQIYEGDEEDFLIYYKGSRLWVVYNVESKVLRTIPSRPVRVPATLVSVKGMQPENKEC